MPEIKILKKKLDVSNMYDAISDFPEQIKVAFSIMENWVLEHKYSDINNIIILGMGGSAIGGDVIRVLIQNESRVPVLVNRSYNIPQWVNKKTLVLASSYSGDTEETLSAFDHCEQAGAKIIAITTGGKLQELAIKHGLDHVLFPAGLQPRAALGLSISLTLIMLNKLGFASDAIVKELYFSFDELTRHSHELSKCDNENPAVILANKIYSMCPIIYGSEDLTWVAALRFRGQLEENAKMLAFHHSIPEQNHNEIEGWSCHPDLLATKCIIWLKDKDDHPRSLGRMKVTAKLLDSQVGKQVEIAEKGRSALIRLLKMIHFIDWVSYYAALLNNVDPTPVRRITRLKEEMAKQ
jgi:glucose/mannose-6-phosphate isomerase